MAFNKEQQEPDTKSDMTFEHVCRQLVEMQKGKGTGYKNSPLNELPLDVWLAQIQIKATRAKYATTEEKMLDELRDTATYSILAILKMYGVTII